MQDMTQEVFLSELKTQSAVLYQLTMSGEAVKRLSQPLREQYPILPWPLLAGMRDHLMHGYDAVDLDEVWKTASRDVPEVLRKLQPLLPKQPGESSSVRQGIRQPNVLRIRVGRSRHTILG
jgi:uncharacterized protein with HEPN domain